MLHDNMNISHLMVHAKHVEEARSRRKSNDAKRSRSFDGGSSKNRVEIQDKPIFKKRFSLQSFQMLVVIGRLTLSSIREKILKNQPRIQLLESVARSTMVIALRGQIIILVVQRVVTKLGIALI